MMRKLPIATSRRSQPTLPSNWVVDLVSGKPQAKGKPEFEYLVEIANNCFDHWADRSTLKLSQLVSYAVDILAINYQFSMHETNVLESIGKPVLDTNLSGDLRKRQDF